MVDIYWGETLDWRTILWTCEYMSIASALQIGWSLEALATLARCAEKGTSAAKVANEFVNFWRSADSGGNRGAGWFCCPEDFRPTDSVAGPSQRDAARAKKGIPLINKAAATRLLARITEEGRGLLLLDSFRPLLRMCLPCDDPDGGRSTAEVDCLVKKSYQTQDDEDQEMVDIAMAELIEHQQRRDDRNQEIAEILAADSLRLGSIF